LYCGGTVIASDLPVIQGTVTLPKMINERERERERERDYYNGIGRHQSDIPRFGSYLIGTNAALELSFNVRQELMD
jgi:hypothetical protein